MMNSDRISYINFDFLMEPGLRIGIHRDWGLYYKRLKKYDRALDDFDKSLELSEGMAFRPCIEKSRCLLEKGKENEALAVAEECVQQFPEKAIALRVEDHRNMCIFEENRFEESLLQAYRTYHKQEELRDGHATIDLVGLTINQSIGEDVRLGTCFHQMRKYVQKYQGDQGSLSEDSRPMWKILRENGECDVISIRDKPIKSTHPIQKKRIELHTKVMRSYYFGSLTCQDIEFLEQLRVEKRLMLPQTKKSNKKCLAEIDSNLNTLRKCQQQMSHRKPFYAKVSYKDQPTSDAASALVFKRLQHRSRHTAFKSLVTIIKLERSGDLVKLMEYVEHVMSNYYEITTTRVFPRKFEFMNEIFNIVGLSILKRYRVPNYLMTLPQQDRMLLLLEMPPDTKQEEIVSSNTFGIKSDFSDPDAPDLSYLIYKEKIDYFEKRVMNSRCKIEKCYLYYRMAKFHLAHRKFDETKQLGKKIIDTAIQCGHHPWQFHGYITMIKVDVAQSNPFKLDEKLYLTQNVALKLSDDLVHYIKMIKQINEHDKTIKLAEEEADLFKQKRLELEAHTKGGEFKFEDQINGPESDGGLSS